MDKKADYISIKELEKIEQLVVDEALEAKIKDRNKQLIRQELVHKALKEVSCSLAEEEYIEDYLVGRDYKGNTTKLLASSWGTLLGVGYIAHPIFNWTESLVLIKTNKRLLAMETASGFKYLKHYEVQPVVNLYDEENEQYLRVVDALGKEHVLVVQSDYAQLVEKMNRNNIDFSLNPHKFQCTEKQVLEHSVRIYWVMAFILLAIIGLFWL